MLDWDKQLFMSAVRSIFLSFSLNRFASNGFDIQSKIVAWERQTLFNFQFSIFILILIEIV